MSDEMKGLDKQPEELMSAQLDVLNKLQQIQIRQREILTTIRDQQEKMLSVYLQTQTLRTSQIGSVKIIDFNMPFWALVGLLIKVALAAIPAAVILAVVGMLVGLMVPSVTLFIFRILGGY